MGKKVKFDISHIDKYAIVSEPCTAIVKCNSTPDFNKPYDTDGYNRWIVSLKVVTDINLLILKEVAKSKEDIYYSQISKLLMSGAIWESQIWEATQLPVKGENVIATFDYVEDALLCTAITVIPKVDLKTFSASAQVLSDIEFFKTMK